MKSSIMIGILFFSLSIQRHVEAQQQPTHKINPVSSNPGGKDPFKADSLRTLLFLRADTVRVDTLRAKSIDVKTGVDQFEIDRLIIDETISKAGYEFFELFNTFWTWPEASTESFIMIITERPYRGISTQIRITVNELVVFENFLQSRYDFMEEMAAVAVEQISGYLLSYAEIIKELEGADFKGTGIY